MSVSFLRLLTLLSFSLGLFVQVSAQAAAMPQMEVPQAMDCAEMAKIMTGDMEKQGKNPDTNAPCENMSLGCLVAMNCIPPLFLVDRASETLPTVAVATSYSSANADMVRGWLHEPASPPPRNTRGI